MRLPLASRSRVNVSTWAGLPALALLALATQTAHADDNDLVLSRLATVTTDNMGAATGVIPHNAEFRALASQLGVALAPRNLTPADTLGFGGFEVSMDAASTSIDASGSYWRARTGAMDNAGNNRATPSSLGTVGMFARKGMWFPIPSFEMGGGAVHLLDSGIWAAQFYAKFALHEGYHQLPLPSLAVRGSVSRMMRQRELDLTVPAIDVLASKQFSIAGTWRLEPYAAWNLLVIVPRSEVIDPTPHIDPLRGDNAKDGLLNFVFSDQDPILRHRFAFGAKATVNKLALTLEANYALAGTSVDDRPGTTAVCAAMATTANCDTTDTAASQLTVTAGAGLRF